MMREGGKRTEAGSREVRWRLVMVLLGFISVDADERRGWSSCPYVVQSNFDFPTTRKVGRLVRGDHQAINRPWPPLNNRPRLTGVNRSGGFCVVR